jgi:hypothetical protein
MTCNDSSIERGRRRAKTRGVLARNKRINSKYSGQDFFGIFTFKIFACRSCHFLAFVFISAHNSVVFNLPTIGSGQGANAQAFSDWYQFGNGTASEIHKGHGQLLAAFDSKAPYNNHAGIYYVTLEAHDFLGEYDI